MDAKVSEWRPGPNVCRCCFTEGCYKDISTEYFWMGKREVYAEMLSETFDLTIAYSKSGGPNSNSRLICENCIARLRDATDFKRQVKECEKTFIQHLDPGNNATTEIELRLEADHDKTVKLESVKLEKRHSDDDFDDRNDFATTLDDDDDDLDDQPLLKLASKTPKKETENVDILDLLDNAKVTEKRKSSAKSKEPPTKKLKKKEPLPKSSASKSLTTEKKKKGYIEASNSSIVLKNEDGTVTRLTLLKRPIPLASLEYEIVNKKTHVDRAKVELRKNISAATDNIRKCRAANERNLETERETKTTNVGLLKDPISLDYLKSNKGFTDRDGITSITFNAKIVQGAYPIGGRQRRRTADMECQIWKQNALTIFKYSQVYPFLYVKNKYKCYVCSRHFLESTMLKHHTLKEHDAKELEQELNNRPRDKYLKVDVSSLDCKICLYIAPDLHTLKMHLKSHGKAVDPDLKDNIVPFKLGGSTHDCQYCDETFIKLRLLVIHMSKHFNNYSCEICGAVSISLDLLKRHLKIHETGTFPCGICDKIFSNAAKRSIHIRGVHLKQFPRRCPICPARFNSNFQRTKHLRVVHNQTSGLFRCETCGREYDLKYHLLIHIRSVHLQERNHECPTCHARFFSKYSLSRHMIIHTGEKNFKCEVCGKAYARSKNLREHSRTHTIGPNPCAVCGQSFLDHTALSNHMNVVHGLCDFKHVF